MNVVLKIGSSGGSTSLVEMMESADPRMADDLGFGARLRSGHTHRRCALAEPEMRPVVVVVRDEFGEESVQVPFVEDNQVVEQIAARAPLKRLEDQA